MDLERFVAAQAGTYDDALAELRVGRKTGHWMWFVLPQVAGLGQTPTSRRYAITDLDEARAYLAHEVLGPRLRECCRAVLDLDGVSAEDVLGRTDAMKLRSSMTLFALADPGEEVFAEVLEKWWDGVPDQRTLALLDHR